MFVLFVLHTGTSPVVLLLRYIVIPFRIILYSIIICKHVYLIILRHIIIYIFFVLQLAIPKSLILFDIFLSSVWSLSFLILIHLLVATFTDCYFPFCICYFTFCVLHFCTQFLPLWLKEVYRYLLTIMRWTLCQKPRKPVFSKSFDLDASSLITIEEPHLRSHILLVKKKAVSSIIGEFLSKLL